MIIFAEKIIFITKNWGLKRNKSPKILKKEEDMAKPRKDGMIDNIITEELSEKAVLVGLITQQQNEMKANEYLDELAFLADTAGAVVVKKFLQRIDQPTRATFVGTGKLIEIREYVEENEIGLVIFDDDLSSKQVSNIEKEMKVKILDRTSLILDIFAKRAQTASAKLLAW